jgi:hypothetical protein
MASLDLAVGQSGEPPVVHFGQVIDHHDGRPERAGEDLRGSHRASQRTGEHRVDRMPTQRRRGEAGLFDAPLGERRVQLALPAAHQVPLGLPVTSQQNTLTRHDHTTMVAPTATLRPPNTPDRKG